MSVAVLRVVRVRPTPTSVRLQNWAEWGRKRGDAARHSFKPRYTPRAMRRLYLDFDFNRSAGQVFNRLTDFRRLTEWRTLETMHVEPDSDVTVGTKLFSTVKGPMGMMHFENEITEMDRRANRYGGSSRWGHVPHSEQLDDRADRRRMSPALDDGIPAAGDDAAHGADDRRQYPQRSAR